MGPWVTDCASCYIFCHAVRINSVDSIYCFMRNRKKELLCHYFSGPTPISSRAQLSVVTRQHILTPLDHLFAYPLFMGLLIPSVLPSSINHKPYGYGCFSLLFVLWRLCREHPPIMCTLTHVQTISVCSLHLFNKSFLNIND